MGARKLACMITGAWILSLNMGCEQALKDLGVLDALTGQEPELPLQLLSIEARATGRFGQDLLIKVQGQDGAADVVGAELRVLTLAGDDVPIFDSDFDGRRESAQGLIVFDQDPRGLIDIEVTYTAPRLLQDFADIARVGLRLLDGHGRLSEALETEVQAQAVRGEGEACDPDLIVDRCASGYGCDRASRLCVAGTAPVLTDLAYQDRDDGPRILVAGEDADDDVIGIELSFMGADGQPVEMDLDNDGIPESSTFLIEAASIEMQAGLFFAQIQPYETFTERVRSLSARAVDDAALWSESVQADFAPPIYRGGSQACDPRGFDVCVTGTLCYPGGPEESRCMVIQALRSEVCEGATELRWQGQDLSYYGAAQGPSLWEPPDDCVSLESRGRPEDTVLLHLDQDVTNLHLSTQSDATALDTVLYLLPGCFSAPEQTLSCNDDTVESKAASLQIDALPAGDYLIVIDSWSREGGPFELSIQAD